ncbi:MAG TPA: xanthine dehydrogenase family protein molybdopterin-binding subunit, partial [Anaerolineae bacterium]|nr:xanthine dehydrogenase family protein molybdopterin-binding subunit [Anaerolineae bacterium]
LIALAALAQRGQAFSAQHHYDAPETNPVPERVPTGGENGHRLHFAYSFGAQGAMVAVNEETGEVRVLKIVAAHDVGRAISMPNCINQIQGGVVMGLGYALSEEFRVEGGYIQTPRLGDLGLLRLNRLPEIEAIVVENPHPRGPYGAKGMGELALSPTAPAVINAIHDAIGVWIHELPATPERVLAALKRQAERHPSRKER